MVTSRSTIPAYPGIRVTAYANPELVFAPFPITRFQQSVTPSDTNTKLISPTYSDSAFLLDSITIYDGPVEFDSITVGEASILWPSIVITPDTVSISENDTKAFSTPDIALGLDIVTVSELITLAGGREFGDTVGATDSLNSFNVSSVLADSASLSEALGRTVSFVRDTIADTATVSEALTFSVTSNALGDSVTITEAIFITVPLADSISLSDGIVLTFTKAATDSATATEVLTTTLTSAPLGIMNASAFNVRAFNK